MVQKSRGAKQANVVPSSKVIVARRIYNIQHVTYNIQHVTYSKNPMSFRV